MKALVAKLMGKHSESDPLNIHVTVFWATIVFWAITCSCFAIVKAVS